MNISSLSAGGLQRPDPAEMRKKMFQETDADGSGAISKEELKDRLAKAPKRADDSAGTQQAPDAEALFAEIDTDGDGSISETENDTFLQKRDEEMAQRGGGREAGALGFKGSSNLMQSLLDALEKGDDTTASSTTDASDAKQQMLQTLLQQLREQQSGKAYTASGTTGGGGTSLFSTTA